MFDQFAKSAIFRVRLIDATHARLLTNTDLSRVIGTTTFRFCRRSFSNAASTSDSTQRLRIELFESTTNSLSYFITASSNESRNVAPIAILSGANQHPIPAALRSSYNVR